MPVAFWYSRRRWTSPHCRSSPIPQNAQFIADFNSGLKGDQQWYLIGGGREEACFPLPSFFPLTHIAQTLQSSQSIHLVLSAVAKALWIMACVTLLTYWGIGSNLEKSRWVLFNASSTPLQRRKFVAFSRSSGGNWQAYHNSTSQEKNIPNLPRKMTKYLLLL